MRQATLSSVARAIFPFFCRYTVLTTIAVTHLISAYGKEKDG
jgi:hypothetical protein